MAGQAFPIAFVIVDEEDEGVVVFRFEIDAAHLIDGGNDPFGEEEAHHEDFIVVRGSHQDRERAAVDDDLQRFFNCDKIPAGIVPAIFPLRYLALTD